MTTPLFRRQIESMRSSAEKARKDADYALTRAEEQRQQAKHLIVQADDNAQRYGKLMETSNEWTDAADALEKLAEESA